MPEDLSMREIEAVKFLAEGKTAKQTAALMGIGVETVEAHKRSIFQKLGIHSTVELIHWALWNKFVPLKAFRELSSYRLSPREIEVATLLGTGMLNKMIAEELGIGIRTVETHRGRLHQKLGYSGPDVLTFQGSLVAADVHFAIAQGLVNLDKKDGKVIAVSGPDLFPLTAT